jgi:hypothetical protein
MTNKVTNTKVHFKAKMSIKDYSNNKQKTKTTKKRYIISVKSFPSFETAKKIDNFNFFNVGTRLGALFIIINNSDTFLDSER